MQSSARKSLAVNRASIAFHTIRILLLASAVAAILVGCKSKEQAAEEKDTATRKYVSTFVNWVSDKMDAAGVKLGSTREQLLDFIKQENYRVCVSNEAYVHAVVPNSKIYPGEQDIHIVGAFGNVDGIFTNLEVQTPLFSAVDLKADCR
jgi:hypothetical protein